MYAVGIADDLVDIVSEGVVLLVEWVHLESTATLAGHTVVVPPGELGDKDLLVVAHHQEIVDGVLQHILTAISKQHLFFRHTVDLTETYRDDTLLALIIDAGIETQGLGIKVLDGVNHFLAGLKVKLVSVEKIKWCIHCNYVFYCCLSIFIRRIPTRIQKISRTRQMMLTKMPKAAESPRAAIDSTKPPS